MNGVFTDRENMEFAAEEQHHRREWRDAIPLAVLTFLLVICALVTGGVDYALLYEIFSYLKAPLPGEESAWSIPLFALTGVLMTLGFHLYASEHPASFVVRALKLSVSILAPLYALGAGLALAAIIYFDGADALFSPSGTGELFGSVLEQSGSPWIEWLISNAALVFVLGCGGLAVITLYATHTLLSRITAYVRHVHLCADNAREAAEAMQILQACDREYTELSRQREDLAAQDPHAIEVSCANDIVAHINHEVAQAEAELADYKLRPKAPEKRFLLTERLENVDHKELEKRIAAIRAITPKTVLAAFRTEPEIRRKS